MAGSKNLMVFLRDPSSLRLNHSNVTHIFFETWNISIYINVLPMIPDSVAKYRGPLLFEGELPSGLFFPIDLARNIYAPLE